MRYIRSEVKTDYSVAPALREHEQRTADAFGITHWVVELKRDLLTINGVVDVEFDLDGYWSDIQQIVFLPKYSIPVHLNDYYQRRRAMIARILEACARHGLTRSGDRIEDYSEHLYIVMNCGWPVKLVVTGHDVSSV